MGVSPRSELYSKVINFYLIKVPFLDHFWPNMNTEMGVVLYMYLKHPHDYFDAEYIWVHRSNTFAIRVFAEIPLLAFLALYIHRRRCGHVGHNPCYF